MSITPEQRAVILETLRIIRNHDAADYMSFEGEDPWQSFLDFEEKYPSTVVPDYDKVGHHDKRNKLLVKTLLDAEYLAEQIRKPVRVKGQIPEAQKRLMLAVFGIIKFHEAHVVMHYQAEDPWACYVSEATENTVKWRAGLCQKLTKSLFEAGVLKESI